GVNRLAQQTLLRRIDPSDESVASGHSWVVYESRQAGADSRAESDARLHFTRGQTIARLGERKVRTRQDTVVGNAHRPRSRGQGQRHRKHTADRFELFEAR